jgi:hypothetical protein
MLSVFGFTLCEREFDFTQKLLSQRRNSNQSMWQANIRKSATGHRCLVVCSTPDPTQPSPKPFSSQPAGRPLSISAQFPANVPTSLREGKIVRFSERRLALPRLSRVDVYDSHALREQPG